MQYFIFILIAVVKGSEFWKRVPFRPGALDFNKEIATFLAPTNTVWGGSKEDMVLTDTQSKCFKCNFAMFCVVCLNEKFASNSFLFAPLGKRFWYNTELVPLHKKLQHFCRVGSGFPSSNIIEF